MCLWCYGVVILISSSFGAWCGYKIGVTVHVEGRVAHMVAGNCLWMCSHIVEEFYRFLRGCLVTVGLLHIHYVKGD